jgi:Spy/CpxP family protein refolding chaperone
MRSIVRTTLPIVVVIVLLTITAAAQSTQDPQPNTPPQGTAPDLLEQLRLTPEQRQKIRQIQRDTKDERAAIGLVCVNQTALWKMPSTLKYSTTV